MNTADPTDATVLLFGGRRLPRTLRGLPVERLDAPGDVRQRLATVVERSPRLIVVGAEAELAAILTGLLRADRLDVEVGPAPNRWAARRARLGRPRPAPLIRDDAGQVIVGAALWLPSGGSARLHGEAVVDDTVLFDGDAFGVRIEPTPGMPGLRAGVLSARGRVRRWVAGRAAQLGTTGAVVVRDGVPGSRPVKRSTFYRHAHPWLPVR